MINYNKLKRLFKDGEWQTIDTYINVDVDLISKIDPEMIRSGFAKNENNKYSSLMTDKELKLFTTVKIMAMYHIRFLINAISKLLRDDKDEKTIETLRKECDTLKTVIDLKQIEIEKLKKELSKPLPDKLREQGLM
jgi:cell division protein FtsB